MADDPDPQLSKPINGDDDIPSQEEINYSILIINNLK